MESLKCQFCEFIGKNEGGIKTHMRFTHTKKMYQLNWNYCEFCNFNSKTESEMPTHISEFKITHRKQDYNQHIHQLNSELLRMSKRGLVSTNFQTAEHHNQYLSQNY